MRFKTKPSLNTHQRSVHSKERPHICEWNDCKKAFHSKPNLSAHMRTHKEEKPFVCDWSGCDLKFKRSSTLNQHKNAVHLKLRPHICEWNDCKKAFCAKRELNQHMRTHTKDKALKTSQKHSNF